MRVGELVYAITSSDRILVLNAARQVIYRGYAANFGKSNVNKLRVVKEIGIGVETYKNTETMWDWSESKNLPDQVPIESVSEYETANLTHIIYTKILLED